jgi:hypothetical protein
VETLSTSCANQAGCLARASSSVVVAQYLYSVVNRHRQQPVTSSLACWQTSKRPAPPIQKKDPGSQPGPQQAPSPAAPEARGPWGPGARRFERPGAAVAVAAPAQKKQIPLPRKISRFPLAAAGGWWDYLIGARGVLGRKGGPVQQHRWPVVQRYSGVSASSCQHELVSARIHSEFVSARAGVSQHELVSARIGGSTIWCQHHPVSARIGVSTNWCQQDLVSVRIGGSTQCRNPQIQRGYTPDHHKQYFPEYSQLAFTILVEATPPVAQRYSGWGSVSRKKVQVSNFVLEKRKKGQGGTWLAACAASRPKLTGPGSSPVLLRHARLRTATGGAQRARPPGPAVGHAAPPGGAAWRLSAPRAARFFKREAAFDFRCKI